MRRVKKVDKPEKNGSRVVMLKRGSEVRSLKEWASIYNIDPQVLRVRLRRGWTLKHALRTPVTPAAEVDLKSIPRSRKKRIRELYVGGKQVRDIARSFDMEVSKVWDVIRY